MSGTSQPQRAADALELPIVSILGAQKLEYFDTPDSISARGDMDFQMFQVPINGVSYFPTATALGPLCGDFVPSMDGPTIRLWTCGNTPEKWACRRWMTGQM